MNYTIDTFDMNALGRSGLASIACQVKGYWSTDTIRVYIQRDWVKEAKWKVSVSYGSGGRDTEVVKSDTEATRYFAEALVAMCDLAEQILTQTDVLEANYQAQAAEYRAQEEAARAAKQAKIEADPELGFAKAREIVGEMLAKGFCDVKMFDRGSDRPQPVSVVSRNKAVFYINGNRTSRAEVIQALAAASVRTAIV